MKHVEFNIPVVRGFQSGHAFYTAMCPIRLLPKLFPVGVDESTSETLQSFRRVNIARVRDIAKKVVNHHDTYHIDSVTVSVEREVRFVTCEKGRAKDPITGELFIPLDSRLTILDGIHRIFGLQRALAKCPSLGDRKSVV